MSEERNSPPAEKSLREIADAWSPVVRGRKGVLGLALHAAAWPLDAAREALHVLTSFPFHFGHENTAGQTVTDCRFIVPATFARMEKTLQARFNAAAKPGATPIDRENFLHFAADVSRDGAALARHCTILRTEFDSVTEPYSFIVRKEHLDGGKIRLTTLDQGLAEIRRALEGAAEPQREAAKNPVTLRRTPFMPSGPGESRARGAGG